MKLRTVTYSIAGILLGWAVAHASALPADLNIEEMRKEIVDFGQIDSGLYRGGQPTEKGLELVQKLGVRTVVNFRHEKNIVEKERKQVEALGMEYISIPWRIQRHPKQPVMHEFLKVINDKSKGPFFIHCRRGAERTGVADYIYRRYVKNMSEDEAWEAATKGYHVTFYWKPFVKRRLKDFTRDLDADRHAPESSNSQDPAS